MGDVTLKLWLRGILSSPDALAELVGEDGEARRGARVIAGEVLRRISGPGVVPGDAGQRHDDEAQLPQAAIEDGAAGALDDSGDRLGHRTLFTNGGGI